MTDRLRSAAIERPGTALPARERLNGRMAALLATTALVATGLLPGAARAVDAATWLANPGSGDFNTAANWTPAAVPTGTAFFGASSGTNLSFSAGSTTVGGWTFNAGAPAYMFTIAGGQTLKFTGAGIVINGGSASITNNGALNFANTSTAGSATITNKGNLTFNNSSSGGSASVANTGLMVFSNTSTAGSASITNSGTLGFLVGSTAGSASITNNGALNFANTSTAGSATITTNSGGRSNMLTSASGGTARFILNGTGLLDISGLATGGTTAGSIEGAGRVFLGSNNLAVGGNNLSTTFSGVVQDLGVGAGTGGSLTKTGSGTLTLSGANTYTGATVVNAGILDVEGSIASPMTTVNANAALTGSGIVGNTQINPGGIFAPGSGTPGSSMTVAGNLAFQSGAIYLVQLNSAAASFANVADTAALAGTVRVVSPTGSYRFNSNDTILTSTGLNGTRFDGLATPVGIAGSLAYTTDAVLLNLTSALGQIAGLNLNQRAVGAVLDAAFNANGNSGGLGGIFAGNVAQNLTQASGEAATGSQQTTFDAMNLFMGVLTDPFIAGRGEGVSSSSGAPQFAETDNASAYADNGKPRTKSERDAYAAIYRKAPVMADPFAQRWSVWAAGYGGSQTTDGNAAAGSNSATSRVAGTAVGADYRFSPFTLAGFALAGGGTNFSVNGSGSGRSDLFQAGAFVHHTVGAAYISAALAYGWQDITTDRTVTIAGADHLRAEFNANAYSGRVEGGYRLVSPWIGGIGLTPYAAGQFTTFDLPAYAEQVLSGANAFALAYGSKSVTDTRSELGLRTDKSYAMQDAILTLRGRLAWAHDYNPDRSIGATFQTLPGASFVVNGAAQASNSALVTASAEMKWMNGWSAAATFEGEFSDVTGSYAGKGVVRYAW